VLQGIIQRNRHDGINKITKTRNIVVNAAEIRNTYIPNTSIDDYPLQQAAWTAVVTPPS